ncbi:hypothetical protein TNCV_1259741 [Trichonephila clavipes]|nr:hypothetical protein TNCV_1259741 [Trichonephila clavipes]
MTSHGLVLQSKFFQRKTVAQTAERSPRLPREQSVSEGEECLLSPMRGIMAYLRNPQKKEDLHSARSFTKKKSAGKQTHDDSDNLMVDVKA